MKPLIRASRVAGRAKRQKGAVAVEMALMLPFLALIFVVVADLGLLLREHQILTNAAREGARYSSLPEYSMLQNPSAVAEIQALVQDYCAEDGITIAAGDVTVTQDTLIPVEDGNIRVSRVVIQVDRELFLPAALFFGGTSVTLRTDAVFRNLY